MVKVILIRQDNSSIRSLGALITPKSIYDTVENPWLNNRRNISCIPIGTYTCKRYSSDKYPNTFEITNVPNRTHILFHIANWAKDLEGCVGLGTIKYRNGTGVGNSGRAMSNFMEEFKEIDEFQLEVKDL